MKESDVKNLACWKDLKYKCLGAGCVAWTKYEKEERKTVPVSEDVTEGWHVVPNSDSEKVSELQDVSSPSIIKMYDIIKYIETDEGECGALPKEQGCFAQC